MKNSFPSKILFLFLSVILGFGTFYANAQETNIKIATWNYMCQEDAFADGYGCPEEIILSMEKNHLSDTAKLTDKDKLEANLNRFGRIAKFLNNQDFDILLLQETEKISRDIIEKNSKFKVISLSNEEAVMMNTKSSLWKNPEIEVKPYALDLSSYPEFKDKVDGIACAVVSIKKEDGNTLQIYLISTHARASRVKGIDKIESFEKSLTSAIKKSFPDSEVIIGGDYNMDFHRKDVQKVFADAWRIIVPDGSDWFDGFTTQHETNFYGAFDGFLVTPKNSASVKFTEVKRFFVGFMPKYLGNGPIKGNGNDCGESILQYNSDYDLVRTDTNKIIPDCNARTDAMSDHTLVQVSIQINP